MAQLESGDVFELQMNILDNMMLEVDGANSEHVFFKNGSKVSRQRVEDDIESGKLVRQT